MTDNQKPAPCPWCGGDAIVASASVAVNDRQWVNCLNKSCGAHGPMNWGNPKGAIAAWNRIAQRHAPAADTDLAALEAAARAATGEELLRVPLPARKGRLDRFGAAANPAAVLALIDEVRRLRAAVARVRGEG